MLRRHRKAHARQSGGRPCDREPLLAGTLILKDQFYYLSMA